MRVTLRIDTANGIYIGGSSTDLYSKVARGFYPSTIANIRLVPCLSVVTGGGGGCAGVSCCGPGVNVVCVGGTCGHRS